jgi:hypothetical protein
MRARPHVNIRDELLAVRAPLQEMPFFLRPDRYVTASWNTNLR